MQNKGHTNIEGFTVQYISLFLVGRKQLILRHMRNSAMLGLWEKRSATGKQSKNEINNTATRLTASLLNDYW